MNLGDIPLFSMLKGRLGYLTERQKLISQNVANSDTPGYVPADLKPFTFDARVKAAAQTARSAGAPAMTQPNHMAGTVAPKGPAAVYKDRERRDYETTLDGNSVELEQQMLKMADARTNYDAAIGFYQKSLGLLRMAARPPRG